MKTHLAAGLVAYVSIAALCISQQSQSSKRAVEEARRELAVGKFADAERGFRELTKHDPSNIYVQIFLGQALFRQEKYGESVETFEKVLDLERNGNKLSHDQHRIVIDQLSMAYGLSGDIKKARALLDDATQQDPDYPLNYYNLACIFADMGDKSKTLENLSLAFQHKGSILKGEEMPNPRIDPSFQKFVKDDSFAKLMKELGYQ